MVTDVHAELMNLMRARLEPFKVPNEVIRQLRDDAIEIMTPKTTRKNGATVMTQEASMAADKLKEGGDPKLARPKTT
jgi:hypothetical protein